MDLNFNGLSNNLATLPTLSDALSRSITPENPTGEPGKGGMSEPQQWSAHLGKGWKCRPNVPLPAGNTVVLADIEGPGAIQQIWMTPTGSWRMLILRVYYDDCPNPAIECPLGDFFASPFGAVDRFAQVSSQPVCVNPGSAMNCFWTMPFKRRLRMTIENLDDEDRVLFYQINYALAEVASDVAFLHAQFRRVNPLPRMETHTILDGVEGRGHYVGTVIGWGSNTNGWWGEGEVKFYLDDDDAYPTICGTGTEDYFLGSYNFENQKLKCYVPFTTGYAGMPHVWSPDGLYQSQQRFGLYRWHITDPIRFRSRIRVTIQALGWENQRARYRCLSDDISSVAFWYQNGETPAYPPLPDRDALSVD